MTATRTTHASDAPEARRRVAVIGIGVETNAFAAPTTEEDFRQTVLARGDEMLPLLDDPDEFAFGARLSELAPWEPVPILAAFSVAGGPVEHEYFEALVADIKTRLTDAGPVDGVFFWAHGGGTTTLDDDLDGAYFSAVRAIVGPDVPCVALLDMHAKVSQRMLDAVDVLVGYRTNPHVDLRQRGNDCAELMVRLWGGADLRLSAVRLPLVLPSVTQLTAEDEPLGDLVRLAEEYLERDELVSASIITGFALGDTRHHGLTVVTVADGDQQSADRSALAIAQSGWADRSRYQRDLAAVDDAVLAALAACRDRSTPRRLLADVSDNPGGGGSGRTTWLLDALLRAGIDDVQLGILHEPAIVAEAWRRGVGNSFIATFAADSADPFARPLTATVHIESLAEGDLRLGPAFDCTRLDLGRCASLRVGGVLVATAERRQQVLDRRMLEHIGLDVLSARVVVLKSRGHFRAGFADVFTDSQIMEVDAPGLTTNNLMSVVWQRLPRPVFPLDPHAQWSAQTAAIMRPSRAGGPL